MSMHKKELSKDEEEGLRAHGLPIGSPSQIADCFRLGMAWQAARQQAVPSDTALRRAGLFLDGLHRECKEVQTLRRLLAAAPQAEQAVEQDAKKEYMQRLEDSHAEVAGWPEWKRESLKGTPSITTDVRNIIQLLTSGEWADHVAKTALGEELHTAVSGLIERRAITAPPAPDVSGLTEALRQYRHNNSDGVVFGYDKNVIDRLFDRFAKRAISICEGEASEWDSDEVIPQKNYAQACANRIRRLRDELLAAHKQEGE